MENSRKHQIALALSFPPGHLLCVNNRFHLAEKDTSNSALPEARSEGEDEAYRPQMRQERPKR